MGIYFHQENSPPFLDYYFSTSTAASYTTSTQRDGSDTQRRQYRDHDPDRQRHDGGDGDDIDFAVWRPGEIVIEGDGCMVVKFCDKAWAPRPSPDILEAIRYHMETHEWTLGMEGSYLVLRCSASTLRSGS